jgi:hypothetical protein
MKKILLSLVILILLIVSGTLGYLYLSLNGFVKKQVETVGPRITRTSVSLDSAILSPFSGSGKLEGLNIGNPEGFTRSSAIKAPEISISVNKDSLLSNTIVINEILISRPEICLEGTLTGTNLMKLIGNIKGFGGSGHNKAEKQSSPRQYIVKRVLITAPQLNVSASLLKTNIGQTLPLSDISLNNVGSDGSGISAADLSVQIMVPLLTSALREGVTFITKEGIKTIQKEGIDQINNAVQGISDFFKK